MTDLDMSREDIKSVLSKMDDALEKMQEAIDELKDAVHETNKEEEPDAYDAKGNSSSTQ